jgi:hypothetical protein
MNVSAKIREIEEQKIGVSGRQVLLVEGGDDVLAFKQLLTKAALGWEKDWVVESAGGKKQVLEILAQKLDWIGVVDRDEWSDGVITNKLQELSNLWVLPRFCIENYLIVPEELWRAFPPTQQQKVSGEYSTLESALLENIEQWVAHGVLWSVINPLWEGLRTKGFKEELLDLEVALDQQRIEEKLKEWHQYLDPDQLLQQFNDRLEEVRQLTVEAHLKQWIHGKKFYERIVHPNLNRLLGQKAKTDRKRAIWRTMEVPADLSPLWKKMGVGVNQ